MVVIWIAIMAVISFGMIASGLHDLKRRDRRQPYDWAQHPEWFVRSGHVSRVKERNLP